MPQSNDHSPKIANPGNRGDGESPRAESPQSTESSGNAPTSDTSPTGKIHKCIEQQFDRRAQAASAANKRAIDARSARYQPKQGIFSTEKHSSQKNTITSKPTSPASKR